MRKTIIAIVAAGFFLQLNPADGWLRVSHEDAVVVERSELIVVGHIRPYSIEKLWHRRTDSGRSWEYHATLVVKDVLKGRFDAPDMPLVFEYGLTPTEGRISIQDRIDGISRHGRIEIWDSGNSAASLEPFIADAREPTLWFLRKEPGKYRHGAGIGKYRVRDPEDIQPLKLKPYFLAYLSDDVENAVRRQMAREPSVAERGQRFLDHMEIERISEIEDPSERYRRLLPFFLKDQWWQSRYEAQEAIVACGEPAGRSLREVFKDPRHRDLRTKIMSVWREMGYTGGADLIVELLAQHNLYWAEHPDPPESPFPKPVIGPTHRDRVYRETLKAVYVLAKLGNAEAHPTIETTLRLFRAKGSRGSQMVESCERTLDNL